jgi:hypothetical protein
MYLDYFTYRKQTIKCPKCNWEGKGSELVYGNFSEKFPIVDMECPSCFEDIGHWLIPSDAEKEKWLKENPNTDTGWDDL